MFITIVNYYYLLLNLPIYKIDFYAYSSKDTHHHSDKSRNRSDIKKSCPISGCESWHNIHILESHFEGMQKGCSSDHFSQPIYGKHWGGHRPSKRRLLIGIISLCSMEQTLKNVWMEHRLNLHPIYSRYMRSNNIIINCIIIFKIV